ncbi:MAG TPA: glycosyltransferase family 4 protein [Vicinamibacterales bacterium]|jgi:glycosyltransferase involved in cell wall biosynthesis
MRHSGTALAGQETVRPDGPVPVALVMTSFHPGGTERQMIELIRHVDQKRWTVHLACFHARGDWLERARASAASLREFPITSFRHASAVREARSFGRWCRELGVLIVHAADLYANVFALPAAAAVEIPVRLGSRRDINPGKTLGQIALQRAAYACAHRVVANSQAASSRLRLEGVSPRKIVVIPNGVDTDTFRATPRLLHGRDDGPSAPRARRRVLMVANLRPEKGHDTLIDAAAVVLRSFPDATFTMAGGGPERDRLMSYATRRGVAAAFSWLGHRNDVAAIARASDIFVLPSRTEAFPNALIEAMAGGLPCIATRTGGIPEIVQDGQTGLLVRVDDQVDLARALCRVMSDERLAADLGAAASRHVISTYSFERMTSAFEHLYAAELGQRHTSDERPMAS